MNVNATWMNFGRGKKSGLSRSREGGQGSVNELKIYLISRYDHDRYLVGNHVSGVMMLDLRRYQTIDLVARLPSQTMIMFVMCTCGLWTWYFSNIF